MRDPAGMSGHECLGMREVAAMIRRVFDPDAPGSLNEARDSTGWITDRRDENLLVADSEYTAIASDPPGF